MKIFLLLGLLLPIHARAADTGAYLGLGTFFQNMFKVTDDPTSKASIFGESYLPEVAVGYRLPNLLPTLGWTILGNKTKDGDKRRSVMRLDLPYLFPSGHWEWKAGGGLLVYRIYGDGSTVTLRNGASSSNFYVPSGSKTSRIFYVAGGGAFRGGKWRTDLDLIVSGVFTRRRALNLSLRTGYEF